MDKRNFQAEMDGVLSRLDPQAASSLLLHSCCAPCSSYVLEYLARHFRITVFYYNPNIDPAEEYARRLSEQERLIGLLPAEHAVAVIAGAYEPAVYEKFVAGLESEPEGGSRCERCFRLRMEETARLAKARGFDYFSTTLTVSPHKNAPLINAIGEELGDRYGVSYLVSDFKKKGGYQRSIELSKQFGLYRQNYCGCKFARPSGEQQRAAENEQSV